MMRIGTALAILMIATAEPAVAQVIDQSNGSSDTHLNNNSATQVPQSVGQSFTPSLQRIDFSKFYLQANNANTSVNTYVRLYSGAGYGGTLLGTSDTIAVTSGATPAYATYTYTFANGITLTPNAMYTLRLAPLNGSIGISASDANPYPGGTVYDQNGAVLAGGSGFDLVFAEGSNAPEPAGWMLMTLGVGAVGAMLRRRRQMLPIAA